MTTFTEHYGLRQPEETDGYDIGEMNENMATIDAAMAAQEESMGEMNEKMGTAADTGTETITITFKYNPTSQIKIQPWIK